jgi:uncharacterized RDD family membrane protein YckC
MEHNPYAAPSAPLDPVVGAPGVPVRVGFGPRFGAALIDAVVVWALGMLLSGLVAGIFPDYVQEVIHRSQAKMDPKVAQQMAFMVGFMQSMARWAAGAIFVGVLYGLIEGFTGRALGKLLLGLRIADADGRAASIPRLLGRMAIKQSGQLLGLVAMVTGVYAIAQVSQAPGWVILIGFLLVLGKKRQSLHDMATKTAVYRNTDVILPGR